MDPKVGEAIPAVAAGQESSIPATGAADSEQEMSDAVKAAIAGGSTVPWGDCSRLLVRVLSLDPGTARVIGIQDDSVVRRGRGSPGIIRPNTVVRGFVIYPETTPDRVRDSAVEQMQTDVHVWAIVLMAAKDEYRPSEGYARDGAGRDRLLSAFPHMKVTVVAATSGAAVHAVADPTGGSLTATSAIETLTLAHLIAAVATAGLEFRPELIAEIHAALIAGKHLLLIGPPGTGKTALGIAIGEAATTAGVAAGVVVTTGSSEWTPADTVGTYRLEPGSSDLVFSRGHVLEAIASAKWIVLDELNRADIDRAIGPLFTVLSGQSTVLRFEVEEDGVRKHVAIVPEGVPMPMGTAPVFVPSSWRLVATMNSVDRDVLFEVSQALMRRFAFVRVEPPDEGVHEVILAAYATGVAPIDDAFRKLASRRLGLGPGITIDFARYVRARLKAAEDAGNVVEPRTILREAGQLIVDPQLGGLAGPQAADAQKWLRDQVYAEPIGDTVSGEAAGNFGGATGLDDGPHDATDERVPGLVNADVDLPDEGVEG